MLNKNNILGVEITDRNRKNILEYVFKKLQDNKKFYIVTPNPEIVVYANRHEDYKDLLNRAEIALPDGIGVLIAAKILGKPLKERITGVDFIEDVCRLSKDQPISIGFLGGKPKIAEKAAECLRQKYPWVNIVFAESEWPGNDLALDHRRGTKQNHTQKDAEGVGVVQRIDPRSSAFSTIDILFVALGAPRQEKWISENLRSLPVKAAMGVGGSLDYISGEVRRAPSWIRHVGFEWLFRLINQPWRWRRQLALLEFIYLSAKEVLYGKRRNV
jgi:N-acetylglucosaminyldiphosphoundecaprenol N-acetyl-beta-D-mannosaminyltransferase